MTATPRHEPLRSPQATVSTVQRRRPMIPRTATADPRPSGSLSERAYLLIRDQIISLKFTPGGVIEESRLMEQLGIGRTPIREALKRLAWENLVRIIPRRGMIVGDINITDLAHISEARIGLEGYAVRVAAGRVQDEDRATMQNLLSELKRLKRTVDNTELIGWTRASTGRCIMRPIIATSARRSNNTTGCHCGSGSWLCRRSRG